MHFNTHHFLMRYDMTKKSHPSLVAEKPTITVIDASNLRFCCRCCFGNWSPMIQEGGRLPRGALVCPWCRQRHRNRRNA